MSFFERILGKPNSSIVSKKISSEIHYFKCDEINDTTIFEFLEFCKRVPKSDTSTYMDGTDILLSHVELQLSGGSVYGISLYVNMGGVEAEYRIEPGMYYFFNGSTFDSVKTLDDIKYKII